ncbi:Oidioi.mRNA.OKI2018_I69.PAR.g9093.t1.cds [Oikopleura dioica]|uniref:Oidioi.mRNA.OKI2018_I69.PAR.g9093.t1.cds n=1 Tax=Oikopleura dioica TaxID=34765 RepID=A0ABN7RND2_OIKDI|nr:Oidioi.mRNA.OKI2018_I69.PAR.g9093.t1.cds [Oikopleura dioica]
MSCGERVTELIGSSDPGFQAKTDAIMDKYWYFFDKDRSDSLSWDEWRYANSAFAVVDALVILEAFDADRDQSLSSTEQNAWRSKMREMFSAFGYQPTPEQHAAMVAAWALSQTDDDPSASLIELSRFNLLLWNSFYQ